MDIFEDEFSEYNKLKLNVSFLSAEAVFLIPPVNSALSGVDLIKRLPCGSEECCRRVKKMRKN